MATKKKDNGYNGLPFSKKDIVLASRYESYILSIILIILVCFDKDVSAIAILLSLSWGGYRLVQSLYLWMARGEHLMQMKLEYKKLGLNTEDIDEQVNEMEKTIDEDIEI